MVIAVVLCLLGFGSHLITAQLDTEFCDPADIFPNPDNLPLPIPGINAQFEQLIEINYKGLTQENYEIYDGKNNLGVSAVATPQNKVVYYANYNYNELLELGENYKCEVGKLNTSDALVLPFLPTELSMGSVHIMYALSAFLQSGALKLTYIGSNQNVRGIPVNEWQGCYYSPLQQTTSRVTFSFSDASKWTPAVFTEDFKTVPVQVLIETKEKNSPQVDIATASISNFRPFIQKSPLTDDYLIPSGYYCPGRQSLKKFPDIPKQFSVYDSVTQPKSDTDYKQGTVINFREEYDYNNKLFRFQTPNLTEVHDFNTGLNYIYDRRTGECFIQDLTISIDSDFTSVNGATVLEMRNPAAFFGITDDVEYQYVGLKYQDGLACDVWVGKRQFQGREQITEWYFMSDEWSSPYQSGQTTRLPVLNLVYFSNPSSAAITSKIYNHWFHFSDSLVSLADFNIERCNRDLESQGFVFSMPVASAKTIRENTGAFLQATHLALAKVARVVILRIAHVELQFASSHVFVSFTLYARSIRYGNVTTPNDDVVLNDAVKNLIDYFSKNQLEIKIPTSPTQTITLYSDKGIKSTSTTPDSFLPINIEEVDQGYDGGAVACIVIMFTLFGVTVGYLLIILHKNKKITLPFLRLFYRD